MRGLATPGSATDSTITHCKIGLGNLQAGPEIAEPTILSHDDSGTQFLVVWQNVANTAAAQNAMSFLVRTAIPNCLSTW
jgi:hypothetical protein